MGVSSMAGRQGDAAAPQGEAGAPCPSRRTSTRSCCQRTVLTETRTAWPPWTGQRQHVRLCGRRCCRGRGRSRSRSRSRGPEASPALDPGATRVAQATQVPPHVQTVADHVLPSGQGVARLEDVVGPEDQAVEGPDPVGAGSHAGQRRQAFPSEPKEAAEAATRGVHRGPPASSAARARGRDGSPVHRARQDAPQAAQQALVAAMEADGAAWT